MYPIDKLKQFNIAMERSVLIGYVSNETKSKII